MMRFTLVALCACFCLNAFALGSDLKNASDEDLMAAAAELTAESKTEVDRTPPIPPPDEIGILQAKSESRIADAAAAGAAQAGVMEAKSESEIPVFAKKEDPVRTPNNFIWRLLGSFAFIGVVGGIMVFAGKKWTKQKIKSSDKVRIELMHQLPMGPKRSVALIRVAGETILVGCTDQSVNFLKSVSLIDDELEGVLGKDFNNFLEDDFTLSDVRAANTLRA